MSLAINTITPEGIVFAADSRQSFRNQKGMVRIGSDNALKLFQINSRVGVAVTGIAFLPENGVMKNISKFIDEFKHRDEVKELNVEEVAGELHSLFSKKYNYREKLKKLQKQIKADLQRQGCEILEIKEEKNAVKFRFKDTQGKIQEGATSIDMINLMVAGYNKDGGHEAYTCHIPGEVQKKRDGKEKGREYGASWIGQIDVVSRIVLGFDGRIATLNFVNQAAQKSSQGEIQKQLRKLEYVIQWGTMTIQDAIDFCTLMIQTTSAIQRFSNGIKGDPGGMPGVGGPIDVAVITPNKGFVWINKKKLKVENVEIDLYKEPDLEI